MSTAIRTFVITAPPFPSRIARALLGRADAPLVGTAAAGRLRDGQVEAARPDVLLIDTGLPPAEDVALVRRARAAHPRLPVAVGVPEDCGDEALAYLTGGATGYLDRGDPADELVAGLRRLARGEAVYPAALVRALFRRLREGPPEAPRPGGDLSRREREVLGLLAAGLLNKEIAARLGISLCTVKNHIHKVLGKLQASHRRDAVHRARVHGLLDRGAPAPAGAG
jgi:DNA-binding NarL/FixJ family response regulator